MFIAVLVGERRRARIVVFVVVRSHEMPEFVREGVVASRAAIVDDRKRVAQICQEGGRLATVIGLADDQGRKISARLVCCQS